MSLSLFARKRVLCWGLAVLAPAFVSGQTNFLPQGGEYAISGRLPGDQVWPQASLRSSGGFVVWQDNVTDGAGLGISARRLDSTFSGTLGNFRVNQQGAGDQERPQVSLLNDGGAVFVWQGGQQGFQRIYARFLSSSNTWGTADVRVNTFNQSSQLNPAVATLADGNVVVVWGSFNQAYSTSLQDVYAQRLSPAGLKLDGEFRVNETTAYNQRTPAIAALSGGGFVVVWVAEQQRFENSVDVFARIYNAAGAPVSSEFLVNSGTNICANPAVASSSDGGFGVVWGEKDLVVRSNSWDVFVRSFSSVGLGGAVRRVNTEVYGDQFAPRISSVGSDFLVVWTSLGQDGSREGAYGQFLHGDGTLSGDEFRVNTTTVSQQMHPAVASDAAGRFLVVWTSFGGGPESFDLFAQRYATDLHPLPQPDPPFVSALSSTRLGVAWPVLAGFSVSNYEVYADGAVTATATVTNNMWTMSGLFPASAHSFQVVYVLTDGRRSPPSAQAWGTTWGSDENFDGLPDDWQALYWGPDPANWPSPTADSDGDGMSNRQEFLAGTDPTDPNSVLRTRLDSTPEGLFLSWNTQPGQMYQVQASSSLRAWTNIGTPRFAAGRVDSIYVGGDRAAYYRVVRLR